MRWRHTGHTGQYIITSPPVMLAASYSNGRVPVRPSVRPITSSLKPIGLLNQSIMHFYSGPSDKITSLDVGNNLTGINDNVRERGLEQKCFRR